MQFATAFCLVKVANDCGLKETAVGLEEGVGLSTGRRCSLKRYCLNEKDNTVYCSQ